MRSTCACCGTLFSSATQSTWCWGWEWGTEVSRGSMDWDCVSRPQHTNSCTISWRRWPSRRMIRSRGSSQMVVSIWVRAGCVVIFTTFCISPHLCRLRPFYLTSFGLRILWYPFLHFTSCGSSFSTLSSSKGPRTMSRWTRKRERRWRKWKGKPIDPSSLAPEDNLCDFWNNLILRC